MSPAHCDGPADLASWDTVSAMSCDPRCSKSLPRLVLQNLMKGTESDFYLFNEEDKITKEEKR